jgi:hypothetical protein
MYQALSIRMRLVNTYSRAQEPIDAGNVVSEPNKSNTKPESFKRSRLESTGVGLEVGTFEFDLSVDILHHLYP